MWWLGGPFNLLVDAPIDFWNFNILPIRNRAWQVLRSNPTRTLFEEKKPSDLLRILPILSSLWKFWLGSLSWIVYPDLISTLLWAPIFYKLITGDIFVIMLKADIEDGQHQVKLEVWPKFLHFNRVAVAVTFVYFGNRWHLRWPVPCLSWKLHEFSGISNWLWMSILIM